MKIKMGLDKELSEGQDVEVDVDNNRRFKELRVIKPSWGFTTVLADRLDYLEKKKQEDNPDIKMIFLNSEGYKLESEKRIIPLGNICTEARTSNYKYEGERDERYTKIRTILEKENK